MDTATRDYSLIKVLYPLNIVLGFIVYIRLNLTRLLKMARSSNFRILKLKYYLNNCNVNTDSRSSVFEIQARYLRGSRFRFAFTFAL